MTAVVAEDGFPTAQSRCEARQDMINVPVCANAVDAPLAADAISSPASSVRLTSYDTAGATRRSPTGSGYGAHADRGVPLRAPRRRLRDRRH